MILDVVPHPVDLSLKNNNRRKCLLRIWQLTQCKHYHQQEPHKKPRSVMCLCKSCLGIFPTNLPALACEIDLFLTSKYSKAAGLYILGPCDLVSLANLTLYSCLGWKRENSPMHWPNPNKVLFRFASFCTMATPFLVKNLYNPGSTSSVLLVDIHKFRHG